jgi:hypothetical protein
VAADVAEDCFHDMELHVEAFVQSHRYRAPEIVQPPWRHRRAELDIKGLFGLAESAEWAGSMTKDETAIGFPALHLRLEDGERDDDENADARF